MAENYAFVADLCKEIGDIPKDGILSRTIYSDNQVKAVLFGFDQDQELSEHTASAPAIIHIIKGEAQITLGKDTLEIQTGSWIHMDPKLLHRIFAKTALVMLLLIFKVKEQSE
ncbi:MAG: cupin domain-containing protein [Thermodesulfobacteriota bacterium]